MPQIFHRSANTISKVSVFGAILILAGVAWAFAEIQRSPYNTRAFVARRQPVQFRTSTTWATTGSIAATATRRSRSRVRGHPADRDLHDCHSQIWTDSPMLEPVRESFRTTADRMDARARPAGLRLLRPQHPRQQRRRLRDLPRPRGSDAADVEGSALHMEWCLECHRNPAKHIRPREQIFNMDWPPRGRPGDRG